MELLFARIEFIFALTVTGIVVLLVLLVGARHFLAEWMPWLPDFSKGIKFWIDDSKPQISLKNYWRRLTK